jgi:hypothetical protein
MPDISFSTLNCRSHRCRGCTPHRQVSSRRRCIAEDCGAKGGEGTGKGMDEVRGKDKGKGEGEDNGNSKGNVRAKSKGEGEE